MFVSSFALLFPDVAHCALTDNVGHHDPRTSIEELEIAKESPCGLVPRAHTSRSSMKAPPSETAG
jgi:hypothetical protein